VRLGTPRGLSLTPTLIDEAGVGKDSPTDKEKILAERANIEYIENI
jgi:hypothetical protein